MLYRATVSFSGQISMAEGEVRQIAEPSLINDLMRAGYIEPIETGKTETEVKKPAIKKRKR